MQAKSASNGRIKELLRSGYKLAPPQPKPSSREATELEPKWLRREGMVVVVVVVVMVVVVVVCVGGGGVAAITL
eukprot:10199-Prorocentrum_lima.AAC.1